MRIFVCGGVNKKMDPKYLEGIEEIGKALIEQGHSLICVGSKTGAIGKIFNIYDKNNGKVKIIVPLCYKDEAEGIDSRHPSIMVRDLYTLQQVAISNSDIIIILPGGNGTLAEMHMLTDNIKAGYHQHKVIVYNINHYYDNVITTLNFMIQAGTMEKKQLNDFTFAHNSTEVINIINQINK